MQPQFRPHGSAGSEPSNFSAPENVLKKGVPHKWIRNYLKTGAETKLRMIPAFYEGQMELPLNPDGGEVDAAIGRCLVSRQKEAHYGDFCVGRLCWQSVPGSLVSREGRHAPSSVQDGGAAAEASA
jgi:hypothetical protein